MIKKALRCAADCMSKSTMFLSFTFYKTKILRENHVYLFHWFIGENCITVFTRVSARGTHLIFGFQRGALIRGRRSFEGGAHLKSQVHNNITSTFLFKNNKTNNKRNKCYMSLLHFSVYVLF